MLRDPPEYRSAGDLLSFGVVNLDKPPGLSVHQVTGWVRNMADVDRAVHSGTPDPKVTGCLPTLLGDVARMAQVFLEGSKKYVSVLELRDPASVDIDSTAAEFESKLYQKPPRKPAVSRRLRVREIHDLDLLGVKDRQALLRIRCELGTYIRKLCHDPGLALGTGGHMGYLRRTATDPFDDAGLATLHDLKDALAFAAEGDESWLRDVVSPAERALSHLPSVTIANNAAREVANDAPVYAPGVFDVDADATRGSLVACFTDDGSAVCLGELVGNANADSGEVVSLGAVLV